MQCYFWFPCQINFCFESKYSIQVSYKYWQYIIYSLNYFRLAKNIVNIKAQQLLIHILTHWNYFDEVCSKEEPLRFFFKIVFHPSWCCRFHFWQDPIIWWQEFGVGFLYREMPICTWLTAPFICMYIVLLIYWFLRISDLF